jgi:hypothetical protein
VNHIDEKPRGALLADMRYQRQYIATRIGVIRAENSDLPEDVDEALCGIDALNGYSPRVLTTVFRSVIELIDGIETPREEMHHDLAHELHSIWDAAVAGLAVVGIDVLAELKTAERIKADEIKEKNA